MLDNQGLLNYMGIAFQTSGKNTARNAISMQCPYCRDHSDHGNLSIYGTYKCWRCGTHKLGDLLKTLGFDGKLDDFFTGFGGFAQSAPRKERPKEVSWNMPGLQLNIGAANYLMARGYDAKECRDYYGFKSFGPYGKQPNDGPDLSHRIMIPVHDKEGAEVSYVARDYSGCAKLRYTTPKPEACAKTVKECLYNAHRCNAPWAIVVEGVFDAIKMGPGAVATFGIELDPRQLHLLAQYGTLLWLYDNDSHAQGSARKHAKALKGCGVRSYFLECPASDPGELDYSQAAKIKMQALQEYVF